MIFLIFFLSVLGLGFPGLVASSLSCLSVVPLKKGFALALMLPIKEKDNIAYNNIIWRKKKSVVAVMVIIMLLTYNFPPEFLLFQEDDNNNPNRCSRVHLLEVSHIRFVFIHGGLLCVFGVLLC